MIFLVLYFYVAAHKILLIWLWPRSQVVRQGSAKPLFSGSIPLVASTKLIFTESRSSGRGEGEIV